MRGLLDPKMDFVFKNIFGNENNPKILISFLNAVLKPENLITGVEIKDTDLNNDNIEDRLKIGFFAFSEGFLYKNVELLIGNDICKKIR